MADQQPLRLVPEKALPLQNAIQARDEQALVRRWHEDGRVRRRGRIRAADPDVAHEFYPLFETWLAAHVSKPRMKASWMSVQETKVYRLK